MFHPKLTRTKTLLIYRLFSPPRLEFVHYLLHLILLPSTHSLLQWHILPLHSQSFQSHASFLNCGLERARFDLIRHYLLECRAANSLIQTGDHIEADQHCRLRGFHGTPAPWIARSVRFRTQRSHRYCVWKSAW